MKLYKYRDLSHPSEADFQRLSDILTQQAFWCARPEELNDPEEFVWVCDYTPSQDTVGLVAQLLVHARGRSLQEAQTLALAAVSAGRLEVLAKPIFESMIKQCRSEIGLLCFGSAPGNTCLWQRYGGGGAGVCIELDAPSRLLNTALHSVKYPPAKSLHVDQLIQSFLGPPQAQAVYSVALLSKPPCWSSEAEIRFVSRKQNVMVCIEESHISALVLGPLLDGAARRRIEEIVKSLTYPLSLLQYAGPA